jgi:hypothetical protein
LDINSVYQLAVQNPFELALEYEDTSIKRLVSGGMKFIKQ